MTALREEPTDRWQVSAEGLRGILDEGGCPLCRLLEPAVGTLLAEWLRAPQLSMGARATLRRAQGFCTPHAWWLPAEGASSAVPAPGLERAVRAVLVDLQSAVNAYGRTGPVAGLDPAGFVRTLRHGWIGPVVSRLTPGGRCPLCLAAGRAEETFGYQLLAFLRQDAVRAMYRPASALCVPHFRWALQAAEEKPVLDCLVEAERQRVAALLAEEPATDWRASLAHLAGGAASAMTVRGPGG